MVPTAVTIGNFDGVHVGHATLIARARAAAGPEGRVVALAFDPHPRSVLRPGSEPERLTTFAQRSALLRAAGADEVCRLEPDKQLLGMTPEVFLRHVQTSFDPIAMIEGADFHFGKGRSGHVDELITIGARLGFAVEIVDPVDVVLGDDSIVTASSSIARWLISSGRIRDAAAVLGRPFEVMGEVVSGDQRGRGLGFPTANVRTEQVAPGAGVYACIAVLPDGRELSAAVHVGERPTIGDGLHRVEAHILGLPTSFDTTNAANGDRWSTINGLEENGWRLTLRFVSRLRDPIAFGSIDLLAAQLGRDCAHALDRLENTEKSLKAGPIQGSRSACAESTQTEGMVR